MCKKYPVWFNKSIIRQLKYKDKLRKKFQKTGLIYYKKKFVNERAKLKTNIDNAYSEYLNMIQHNITNDSRLFWQFIKNKKGSISIPKIMTLNGTEFRGGSNIANAFANHFSSVYNNDSNSDYSQLKLNAYNDQVKLISVQDRDIYDAVENLKIDSSVGPDKVPSYIIKGCVEFFIYPLKFLFNLSLQNTTFPDLWKEVRVCPVHKKGDKTNIINYRPISVLSVPAKLFEYIMFQVIHRSVCSQISIHQHGFMRNRSTVSNLSNITQFISDSLNSRTQVDVIYTDFQKAFDKVSHRLLLHKLEKEFGFHDNFVKFMVSYLDNRKQRVYVNGYSSEYYHVTSGVPQGSNLGPLLFLMYINSLTHTIQFSKFLLFADDLKIYTKVDNIEDCLRLQTDINSIYDWSLQNELLFNIDKCHMMSFCRNRSPILYDYIMSDNILPRVETVRDLGVTFDCQLNFIEHVVSTVTKASRMYGFMVRNTRQFTNIQCIKQLYISFVRSQLEYCSVIWSPYYNNHICHIEKVQNRLLRLLNYKENGIYDLTITKSELLQRYNLYTLEKRRKISFVVYLHGLLHGKVDDCSFVSLIGLNVPSHTVRSFRTFYLGHSRTNYHLNSPLYSMCNLYNKIQEGCDIFTDSLTVMRQRLNDLI